MKSYVDSNTRELTEISALRRICSLGRKVAHIDHLVIFNQILGFFYTRPGGLIAQCELKNIATMYLIQNN